jgi:hypothetical protein
MKASSGPQQLQARLQNLELSGASVSLLSGPQVITGIVFRCTSQQYHIAVQGEEEGGVVKVDRDKCVLAVFLPPRPTPAKRTMMMTSSSSASGNKDEEPEEQEEQEEDDIEEEKEKEKDDDEQQQKGEDKGSKDKDKVLLVYGKKVRPCAKYTNTAT